MFKRNPQAGEAPVAEDPRFTDASVPSTACCCVARPVVKVIMPRTASRPHPVDLWLCGHHYRASLGALIAAGATIEDLVLTAACPRDDRDGVPARDDKAPIPPREGRKLF